MRTLNLCAEQCAGTVEELQEKAPYRPENGGLQISTLETKRNGGRGEVLPNRPTAPSAFLTGTRGVATAQTRFPAHSLLLNLCAYRYQYKTNILQPQENVPVLC